MIYWATLLHFYQPPTQIPAVLEKVCNESYRPLIDVFRQHPLAKVTVNINAVLTEMLRDHGHSDVIEGLKELAQRGQVEFVGSGKYHPILPLIPRDEMRRQIVQNKKSNRNLLGSIYDPAGFFPPEMCYSRDIVEPIVETGHEWLVLSGVACPVEWPLDVIHRVEINGAEASVLFRDDILSNKISFRNIRGKEFLQHLEALKGNREKIYVITAMDAETFGHHIQNWEKLFLAEVYETINSQNGDKERLAKYSDIKQRNVLAEQHESLLSVAERANHIDVVTVGELLRLFPRGQLVQPKASSWSSSAEDLAAGNPYPLWKNKGNHLHHLQWEHMQLTIDMVKKAMDWADTDTSQYFASIARGLLDRALHSCQFWWASRRPMWDINLINRGLLEQHEAILNAYKAIKTSGCSDEKKTEYYYRFVAASDLQHKIIDQLFLD